MTLREGIHEIDPEIYHMDPCPEPSLSRSGIQRILTGTPAEFAAHHPRLTQWPDLLNASSDAMDLGDIVHAMTLGVGARYVVGNPGDFLSKEGKPYSTWSGKAKEWKDEQEAAGVIVINDKKAALARDLADRLTEAIEAKFGAAEWAARRCEQAVIFRRRTNDGSMIWCRVLVDALLPSGIKIDVKTTAFALTNDELGKRIALDGLDIQHAFYQDAGVERADQRRPFVFAFVRTVAPFTVRFVNLDDPDVGWPLKVTRMRIDVACDRFAEGLRTGVWPDEPIEAQPLPPTWWVMRCEEEAGMAQEIAV